MKAAFLVFEKRGVAMTAQDLAVILNVKPDYVRRNSKPPHGFIPRIPYLRQLRFDPMQMIAVFCQPPKVEGPRSLTIERHKAGAKPSEGVRKCL